MTTISRYLLLTASLVLLSACAGQAPVYTWYHNLGGEYLFEYDKNVCAQNGAQQGKRSAAAEATDDPFFSCMYQHGYVLIDDAGNVLSEPASLSFGEFRDNPENASAGD